jgi:hypothetical protein
MAIKSVAVFIVVVAQPTLCNNTPLRMFAMVMKAIMMSEPTMYPWAHASTTSAFCWVGMGLCPTTFAATSRRSGLIAVVRVFAGAEVEKSDL